MNLMGVYLLISQNKKKDKYNEIGRLFKRTIKKS